MMISPEIFDHNTAILGRTGGGKSFAARGIVEGWLTPGGASVSLIRRCVVGTAGERCR
jgi:hypothetical protein